MLFYTYLDLLHFNFVCFLMKNNISLAVGTMDWWWLMLYSHLEISCEFHIYILYAWIYHLCLKWNEQLFQWIVNSLQNCTHKGESLFSDNALHSWLFFWSQLNNPLWKCQKQIILFDFYRLSYQYSNQQGF